MYQKWFLSHVYILSRIGRLETRYVIVVEMLSHSLKQWLSTWWGRQGQPRWAQVPAVHLSDQKECGARPYLRVGSGGEGILLEIPACLRPSKGKQLFYFVSTSMAAAFGIIFTFCSLELSYPAVIAVFSIAL